MAREQDKAGRQLGPSGETVRANIKRIRETRRIPVTELSRTLEDLGRPIPPLGLRRIEDGTRRVDVDDLIAIAVALEVSPTILLMPDSGDSHDRVTITGMAEQVRAVLIWGWLQAELPLSVVTGASPEDDWNFAGAALPSWLRAARLEELQASIELGRIKADLKAGGERAEAARRRWDELVEERRPDGYR